MIASSLLSRTLLSRLPAFEPGSVWLAGAGPGDPGLLTLLAAKALGEADAIVHDALVGGGILEAANPHALLVDMGKRAGHPSPKQEAINARLVELAREGRRVLRLKGGDPFVFGRGGEECLALAEAEIPFRVVPGVTAGIGGLAYAGIPVTHRGFGTTATFVTGHDKAGGLPADLDWNVLARLPGALVFYMALGTIGTIAERLEAAGKPPMTPVAIVSSASTEAQSVIETNLAHCARDVVRLQAKRPAIVVVGEVVRLRALIGAWQQTTGQNPFSVAVSA
ncbi:uroporphyrinogen-III C-methyltransferase [Azospirillum argentinense]|uniref:uroporphyrinogen-III C-methyltransferase n=1 Tax=Azospirillum brasilense TaxID=192 RepID=A0A4D8Q5S2_AZOBR|nr:uroporphyrinogen-III C-methyltransferase [Azospirillum argentinense]QCO01532.1 uroporphyrinogen-III C-methyltransferase [Azospirillum argentinense]